MQPVIAMRKDGVQVQKEIKEEKIWKDYKEAFTVYVCSDSGEEKDILFLRNRMVAECAT